MNKIIKFIEKIYPLKSVIRYSNQLKITQESVAEHCYFVSLIVIKLREKYDFDLAHALKMALMHDYSELNTGDVIFTFKTGNEEAKKFWEQEELRSFKNIDEQYTDLLQEFINQDTLEAIIVKAADVMSVVVYANAEIALGNTKFRKIKSSSVKRLKAMFKKIKHFVD